MKLIVNSRHSGEIAGIIKERRVSTGLTIQEIAMRSGVSSTHIGRIERGERIPSAAVLRKIAEPLGFGERELLMAAQYLSSQEPSRTEEQTEPSVGRLDPSVAMMLSQEPVEVQRAAIGILSILKNIARGLSNSKGLE